MLLTSDGGTMWQLAYAPGPVSSVACSNPMDCVAVGWGNQFGFYGDVVTTTDGGLSWQRASGNEPALADVSCVTSTCIGVGPDLARSTDTGESWQDFGVSGGTQGETSVTCLPSTTTCVMVGPNPAAAQNPNLGTDGFLTTDAGQTWTNISSEFPPGSYSIGSISCPTSQICYASGSPGLTGASTEDGGQTWTSFADPSNITSPPPITGVDPGEALSCAGPQTCVLVGAGTSGPAVAYTTDGAANWSSATTIG